ncbi:MAG: hypothetical protein KIT14_04630 [bacterium]|nr:hypothetical protein [bacterium]
MSIVRCLAGAALALLIVLGAGPASAACVCGDRDGCLSAGLCFGSTPGDGCFDAKTCKIVVGSHLDETCCCVCSRPIGPIGCNYGRVGLALSLSFGCGSITLPEEVDAVRAEVLAKLARADLACRAQKNAARRANLAVRQIGLFRRKLYRAARRGKITRDCADGAAAAIDAFVRGVRQVEQGEAPGSTTTTTLPPTACLVTFGATSSPSEVDVRVRCDGSGGPFQRFQVVLGGGRALTNSVAPPLFTCAAIESPAGEAILSCRGTFALGEEIVARIRTGPPPAPAMPAQLFVFDAADARLGPFPATGP